MNVKLTMRADEATYAQFDDQNDDEDRMYVDEDMDEETVTVTDATKKELDAAIKLKKQIEDTVEALEKTKSSMEKNKEIVKKLKELSLKIYKIATEIT